VINYPQVSVILSGMTTLEQLKENIEIFSSPDAVPNSLSPEEKAILARVKERYESIASIPCASCEYCQPCPQGVRIPDIFSR
jgi:predicted aldo/keto reductase-like oxidoreductase